MHNFHEPLVGENNKKVGKHLLLWLSSLCAQQSGLPDDDVPISIVYVVLNEKSSILTFMVMMMIMAV